MTHGPTRSSAMQSSPTRQDGEALSDQILLELLQRTAVMGVAQQHKKENEAQKKSSFVGGEREHSR